MPESAEDRSDDHSRALQTVRATRDSYSAVRDVNVYHGVHAAPVSGAPGGPGLFSVRPPYGRLPAEVRGRGELVDLLWEEVSAAEPRLSVVHGLGGCGKTTVSLSVAHRAREQGREVWWVSAAHPATLHSGLRQLAIELGVDPKLVQAAWEGELSAPDLVWRSLEAREQPWLLVVDEADDPTPLSAPGGLPTDGNGWLRQGCTGAVLVTTRDGNPDLWRNALLHPLHELPPSQAATILIDQLRAAGLEAAHCTDGDLLATTAELADTLGGLPLALQMAGSFLGVQCRRHFRRAGIADAVDYAASAVRTYDAQVRANVALLDNAVSRRTGSVRSHTEISGEARVTATWERSLRLLEDRGMPEARILLQILACYEATPVPLRTLDSEILAQSPLFPEGMDTLRLDDALDALFDLAIVGESLVQSNQGGIPCMKVHRLVGETVAAQTTGNERHGAIWSLASLLLAEATSTAPTHEGEALWWTITAPHHLRLLQRCPGLTAAVPQLLRVVRPAVGTVRDLGSFRSSIALATAAYDLAVRTLGPHDRETLLCRYTYANSLSVDSRGPEATVEIRATWLAQNELLGGEHPDTLASRSYFADRRALEGHYPEAERHLVETAEICARVLGPDHEVTLQTQNRYAMTLRKIGRCRESVELHRDVLARREATLGRTHIDVTRSRDNLAFTLTFMGRYREGEAEYRLNLDARRTLVGPEHALTLVTMSNLAVGLRDTGNLDEAESLCQQVIDTRSETRGTDHTATLIPRSNMIRIRLLQGRAAEVVGEARIVLEARQRQLGPTHPSTLLSLQTLGSTLLAVGQLTDAEALLVDLHALRLARVGAEHSLTLSAALELARLRDAQSRYTDGLSLARTASEVWGRSERTQHITAFELRFQVAALKHELGEIDRRTYGSTLVTLLDEMADAALSAAPLAEKVRRELRIPGSRHGA